MYIHEDVKAYLLVYVDNIILVSSSKQFTEQFVEKIIREFATKDLGIINFFFGIHVNRLQDGSLILTQHQYLANLLHEMNLANLKPTPTQMEPRACLYDKSSALNEDDSAKFRKIVGSLQYLTTTRRDISFSVNKISQLMTNPSKAH